jgi:hypothetical protein
VFSQEEPNLSSNLNVKGLQPVLKELNVDDQFNLQDAKGT